MNEKAVQRQPFIGRTPVRSVEVEFMRKRLEGELVQSVAVREAILYLRELESEMSSAEKRRR